MAKPQSPENMELAALISSFLTPFLPHLLKLGKPVAEEAGKKLGENLGEGTWNKAKQVWSKLKPKVEENALAKVAAETLAANEANQDSQAFKDSQALLIQQLKNVLTTYPELAVSLQQLLHEDAEAVQKVVTVTQTVKGNKNIVIGEASGAVNITQG